ncbi:MAG: hypothetical protein HC848_08530 [Limnobacter sp.]|nr:hypothetical protein [Limnobacter sp.]
MLYGLLNLDNGTLLMAGVGNWWVLLAQPQQSPEVLRTHPNRNTHNVRAAVVLHQNVIRPGTRIFVHTDTTAQALGLAGAPEWQKHVLGQTTAGCQLTQEFGRLNARINGLGFKVDEAQAANPVLEPALQLNNLPCNPRTDSLTSEPDRSPLPDLALMGFQWREPSTLVFEAPEPATINSWNRFAWTWLKADWHISLKPVLFAIRVF